MSCAILLHPSVPHVSRRYKYILPITIALQGYKILSLLQCRGAKEDRETRQERRQVIGHVRNSRFLSSLFPTVKTRATSFHANNHWRQLRDKGHQSLPCQTFPEHDFPRLIHSSHMKYPLCQIDPDYAQLLLYWIDPLLCGMISAQPEIILAYGSHSAKAGPLHYNLAGSMMLLLAWLCWGAGQERVCLDPHLHYK
jgi:hypothetical protein